jgi:hypothetical protein
MVVGVTPRTALIALRVQPSSATTCSLVKVVRDCSRYSEGIQVCIYVWTDSMGPSMHAYFMSGHVLINEHIRAVNDTGPNNIERRLQI